MNKHFCFTQISSINQSNVLKSNALILPSYSIKNGIEYNLNHCAVWDTGATISVIDSKIITELNLSPIIGPTAIISLPGHEDKSNFYYVDIVLPGNIFLQKFPVLCMDNYHDCDIIIGMDIITLGDFCVTRYNNKVMFSFMFPHGKPIDFTNELK